MVAAREFAGACDPSNAIRGELEIPAETCRKIACGHPKFHITVGTKGVNGIGGSDHGVSGVGRAAIHIQAAHISGAVIGCCGLFDVTQSACISDGPWID